MSDAAAMKERHTLFLTGAHRRPLTLPSPPLGGEGSWFQVLKSSRMKRRARSLALFWEGEGWGEGGPRTEVIGRAKISNASAAPSPCPLPRIRGRGFMAPGLV